MYTWLAHIIHPLQLQVMKEKKTIDVEQDYVRAGKIHNPPNKLIETVEGSCSNSVMHVGNMCNDSDKENDDYVFSRNIFDLFD